MDKYLIKGTIVRAETALAWTLTPPTPESTIFWAALRQWLRMRKAAKLPPLCLACDTELRTGQAEPLAFFLLVTYETATGRPANHPPVMSGICKACTGKTDAELLRCREQELMKMAGPSSRSLGIVADEPQSKVVQ